MQTEKQTSNQQRAYDREYENDGDGFRTFASFGLMCGILIGIAGFNSKAGSTTDNILSTKTPSKTLSSYQPASD